MAEEKPIAQPLNTLQQLIRIPSYFGEERPKQLFIQQQLQEAGVEAIFQNDNLVVHLQGKDQTRAMIFNGHVDVVDVGDENRWTHRPWNGDIEDGRIYGRGVSDMQSGLAAEIELAKRLAKRETLPCDVWFSFVVREEVDGSGTDAFAKWFADQGYTNQYKEVAVIFGEPTDMHTAEYGHRGNYFLKASIDGEAGHASRPAEIGTHAIVAMTHFMADLEAEGAIWQEKFAGGEFAPPTITPTAIEAKTGSPNKVSDHAEATFDMRTIPGFHEEAFARVQEIAATHGISIEELYPNAPTGYTDLQTSSLIRALQELIPGLALEVSAGSADLGFMTRIGAEGILFGPGEAAQSHRIDESAPISQVSEAVDIYEQLYDAWATQTRSRRATATGKRSNTRKKKN